ncbi:MAG: ElyC/SanA/YdcF family protein [Propionicimonas sp.]
MLWPRSARTVLAAVLVVLLPIVGGFSTAPGAVAATAPTASATTLRVQAIYFEKTGDTSRRDLAVGSLAAASAWQGQLWVEFLAYWDLANKGLKINTTTPKDLPGTGHAFVVLGSALSKSGRITVKIERRLKVALAALKVYPASKVLVSGGAVRNGHSEAQVMSDWLLARGVKANRIIREARSSSTISNATKSMAILHDLGGFTSYTLISDASHIRRSAILFTAAKALIQEKTGKPWPISLVSNIAYNDKPIASRGPVPGATHKIIASNVASVFGVLAQYNAMVGSPPSKIMLTSIAVTAPKTVTYQVGQKLNTSGLVVTALYNKGSYLRTVTGSVKVTGFSSSKVGKVAVKVAYATGGVTKAATFPCTIVRTASAVALKPSTSKIRKARTRATVRATVTTDVASVVASGKVRFYLDGKFLKTITLDADDKGVARLKLPKIARTGTHEIRVRYLGSSKVAASTRVLKVKVTK